MLTPATVLDAASTVAEALERLQTHLPHAHVVLRRQIELELFFYIFSAGALRERLQHTLESSGGQDTRSPEELDLRSALDLHEHEGDPTVPAHQAALAGSWEREGDGGDAYSPRGSPRVVLDGPTVLGIQVRNHLPPAPPSEPARPSYHSLKRPPLPARPARRTRSWRPQGGESAPAPVGSAPPLESAPRTRSSSTPRSPSSSLGSPAPTRRFQAHPLLELERDIVPPGEAFELTVGLSQEAVPGVSGTTVTVELPPEARELSLDVQLVADGFQAPAGWRFRLEVPVADPGAHRLRIPLIAPETLETRLSILEVHFSWEGRPCGVAFRSIAVQPPENALDTPASYGLTTGTPWLGGEPTGGVLVDPSDPAPDLWITISKPDGDPSTGRFLWSFTSPHSVHLPDAPIPMDLGRDAHTFATRLIAFVREREGQPLLRNALAAVGRQIRDKAPEELERILRDVEAAARSRGDRAPTILLHSAETYIPWELALLEDSPDHEGPAFLGARFAVGRWILGARGVPTPPPLDRQVRRMAVVAGDYRSSMHLRPLPQAEAEGRELEARYGAIRLAASVADLQGLLEGRMGTPPAGAESIHFACHGEVDPKDPAASAIYLDNDQRLDPLEFLAAPIGRASEPFLFLNACQVGHAGEFLGDVSGFAGNCLRNGFRGFLAPLWNVDDRIAHEIALHFYEAAFGDAEHPPLPVSEIIRGIRGRYQAQGPDPAISTYLAYVFYGHPSFRLERV